MQRRRVEEEVEQCPHFSVVIVVVEAVAFKTRRRATAR